MGFGTVAALFVASFILNELMRPKPELEDAKRLRASDIEIPQATEGQPLQLIYGRTRIKNPMVIFQGGFTGAPIIEEVKDSVLDHLSGGDKVTVGYTYGLTFQMCLGQPGDNFCKLLKIFSDDKIMWQGSIGSQISTNNHTQHYIKKRGLLGGRGRGGGYEGFMYFWPGTLDQTNPPDWNTNIDNLPGVFDSTEMPAYRGQAVVGFERFALGESPNLRRFSFEVQTQLNDISTVALSSGDENPIEVIYDILTREEGGLGLAAARVNAINFAAAHGTLVTENNGWSGTIPREQDASQAIKDILEQIDGVLYMDPVTQQIEIKLIREDYSIPGLDVFDESNIVRIADYSIGTLEETYNQIRVEYTNRDRNYTTRIAYAHDPANIASQGKIKSFTLSLPHVHTARTARAIATRELRHRSTPLAKVRLVCNREAYDLQPGDVINWSWNAYGIGSMILRVGKVNLGDIDNGLITVDCVQDVFATDYTIFDLPSLTLAPPLELCPIYTRKVMEAPRWIQRKGVTLGKLNDINAQRLYYLATQPGYDEETYQARTAITTGLGEALDSEDMVFPTTFQVETEYAYNVEPYDTTVGLRIKNVQGDFDFSAAVDPGDTEIQNNGAHLALIGDELISWETATDLGGGTWRLNNVWRALADTVPATQAVNTRGYLLTTIGLTALGKTGFQRLQVAGSKLLPVNGVLVLDRDDAEIDSNTIQLRTILPYPVADLRITGNEQDLQDISGDLKAPDELYEGGINCLWRERSKDTEILRRGDDVTEIQETGVVYEVQGQQDIEGVWRDMGSINANPPTSVINLSQINSGNAGHGACKVRVRSSRQEVVDNAIVDLKSWQHPTIPIDMAHWRNLLVNPALDFAGTGEAAEGWTENTGTAQIVTTGTVRLGDNHGYITGDGVDTTNLQLEQVVDIAGWKADQVSAALTFYARNFAGDADDTILGQISALDSSDVVLGSVDTGTITPGNTNWTRYRAAYTDLPANTAKLRIRFDLNAVTDSLPSVGMAWPALRVGQFSAQLLNNEDFESGTTSWTTVSGVWTTTTTPYLQNNCLIGGVMASGTLRQDVACPAGFEYGTAVLECARSNNNADDDEIEVKLQALNAGGTVLGTATTGSEFFNTANRYERRTLSLFLPDDTTQVRVEFVGTRATGDTTLGGMVDDCDLRIHKSLHPDLTQTFDFSTATQQKMPLDKCEFERDFPTVTTPDLLMLAGDSLEVKIGSPTFEIGDSVVVGAKAVGLYDGTNMVDSAFEFPLNNTDDQISVSSFDFGNFTANDDFSVLLWFRWSDPNPVACSLAGRIDAQGWSIEVTSTGLARARLEGDGGTVTVTGSKDVTEGGWTYVALVYDSTNQVLHLIDEDGDNTGTTVGVGGIHENDGATRMHIGRKDTSDTIFRGQMSRVFMWSSVETNATISSMWNHAGDPTGSELGTYAKTGRVAAVVGSDTDGPLVARFNEDQFLVGYDADLDTSTENGLGLVCYETIENLIRTWRLESGTHWSAESGCTVTTNYSTSVEGFKNSALVSSDNTAAFRALNFTLNVALTDVYVVWFAKASTAHDARISLYNDSGVQKEDHDYSVTTTWQRFEHRFTSWDGSTADGRLQFYGSDDGTERSIEISPVILITHSPGAPLVFPVSGDGAATETATAPDATLNSPGLTKQFNSEGEIAIEGTCGFVSPGFTGHLADANNGTNNNDRREMRLDVTVSDNLFTSHRDGVGAAISANTGVSNDWSTEWTARLRWCRSTTFDGSTVYARSVSEDGDTDNVRTGVWTESLTALTEIDVGHSAGSSRQDVIIRRIKCTAREQQL